MTVYFAVVTVAFLSGLVQGLTGFGSALVAMPLLLLFIDSKTAVPLSVLNGLVITTYLTLQLRHHLDWKKIFPLVIGCIPGIAAGVYFLKNADNGWIKLFLGILLIGYSLFNLTFKPRPVRLPPFSPYVAGFATGLIGGAFSAGGPPAIIYTTLAGWKKDEIKATLSGFFLVTGGLIALTQWAFGLTGMVVWKYLACGFLPVILGVYLGIRLYSRTTTDLYIRMILLLLMGMGLLMVFTASW